MIIYNMRNRGPYEYDKFAINILQLYNAINMAEMHELKNLNGEKNSLNTIRDSVNDELEKIISISEEIYNKTLTLVQEG